jgi:hypothetical protein
MSDWKYFVIYNVNVCTAESTHTQIRGIHLRLRLNDVNFHYKGEQCEFYHTRIGTLDKCFTGGKNCHFCSQLVKERELVCAFTPSIAMPFGQEKNIMQVFLFLPSADYKVVCRRPWNHFLTPLHPYPETLLKSVTQRSPMTHFLTN